MKRIKLICLALTLTVSASKLFAQTEQATKGTAEVTTFKEEVADDPVNDFFKRYELYLKDQKAVQRPPSTPDLQAGQQKVNQAITALQNNERNLAIVSGKPVKDNKYFADRLRLNEQYLSAMQDRKIFMAGPPSLTPLPVTIEDRLAALKKAVADKEALDKKAVEQEQKTTDKP